MMAGRAGFEPANTGTKTRGLTTWQPASMSTEDISKVQFTPGKIKGVILPAKKQAPGTHPLLDKLLPGFLQEGYS